MIVTANLGADIERHGDDDTKMDDTVVVSSPISCWVIKDANAQLDGTELYLLVAPSLRAVKPERGWKRYRLRNDPLEPQPI